MRTTTKSRRRVLAVLAVTASLGTGIAGCSSSGTSASSASRPGAGSGVLQGKGGLLMVFMPSTSNVYLKAAAESIKTEAASLDYKAKIVENDFDQTEQDQQVQEWLATGEKASAVLFWPASAAAATNSLRQLSAKAPVIQWNQAVQSDAKNYVTAYAGVSDTGIGVEAAKDALAARDQVAAAGMKFHGPNGKPNLVEIRFTAGYAAGDDREKSHTASPVEDLLQPVSYDDEQCTISVERVPRGVAGAIVPWNMPVVLAVMKLAPALATGNTLVLKPSPFAPAALTLALQRTAAELPDGVLNVVHGERDVGSALTRHPLVPKVGFTGGTATAQKVVEASASTWTPIRRYGQPYRLALASAQASTTCVVAKHQAGRADPDRPDTPSARG